MTRAAVCYYSGSGNTELACRYLASRSGGDLDLFDVTLGDPPDLAPYDAIGLAAPTDFGGLPQRFETFLGGLAAQDGRPAFCLNTYGFQSGCTLPTSSTARTTGASWSSAPTRCGCPRTTRR